MIFSGLLTETLKFYEVVETQSASGFKTTEERLFCTIRAERLKNKQNYTVNADELFHTCELSFRLRYREGMNDTNIVEYQGERYRITSMDRYTRDNEVVIIMSKINE